MSGRRISRRAALARLGLGVATAYVAPGITGLSTARASSRSSPASPASPPSIVSPPSPASPPSIVSAASGASGPSAAGARPSGGDAPARSFACRVPGGDGQLRISRKDFTQVQRAIRSGEARPLREVLNTTARQYPGQPVRVTFSQSGSALAYHIQIVTTSGDVMSVTVDAGSGAVTGAWKC